jgi:hypothetical protein
VPLLCGFYPGICLTTEEKARKNPSWNDWSRRNDNLPKRPLLLPNRRGVIISERNLIFTLTDSTEKNLSWEADSYLASHEIPHILRILKSHGRVHKCPSLTSSYPEPDQSSSCSTFHFLDIYFVIILPSMPRSSKWPFPLGLPTKILHISLRRPSTRATPPPPNFIIRHVEDTLSSLSFWQSLNK